MNKNINIKPINSMYRKIATFFGVKLKTSSYDEYELVQACTDSFQTDLENDIKYYEGKDDEKDMVISHFSTPSSQ